MRKWFQKIRVWFLIWRRRENIAQVQAYLGNPIVDGLSFFSRLKIAEMLKANDENVPVVVAQGINTMAKCLLSDDTFHVYTNAIGWHQKLAKKTGAALTPPAD